MDGFGLHRPEHRLGALHRFVVDHRLHRIAVVRNSLGNADIDRLRQRVGERLHVHDGLDLEVVEARFHADAGFLIDPEDRDFGHAAGHRLACGFVGKDQFRGAFDIRHDIAFQRDPVADLPRQALADHRPELRLRVGLKDALAQIHDLAGLLQIQPLALGFQRVGAVDRVGIVVLARQGRIHRREPFRFQQATMERRAVDHGVGLFVDVFRVQRRIDPVIERTDEQVLDAARRQRRVEVILLLRQAKENSGRDH